VLMRIFALGSIRSNREYIEAELALATASAMFKQVESLVRLLSVSLSLLHLHRLTPLESLQQDESVRGLIIGPKGPKVATRDVLVADCRKKLVKAKKLVELTRPEWLDRLEEQRRKAVIRGMGRGR
jgi:hypothetical protein